MIVDADALPEGALLQADVCIVGTGAAGIALALRLMGTGREVLLLESGSDRDDPATQALYDGEVADLRLHPPAIRYRQRRFGGSTGIWGGRCIPFDEIDFEHRPWIDGSGWPFGLDALLPYYPAANRLCEAGPFAYTAAAAFPEGMRPMLPSFIGRHFTDDTLERFSCPTDFGRRYRHRLEVSRTTRVVQHANVVNIDMAADGARVRALDVRTLAGRSLTVQAEQVVLATGGLETPRLLLASGGSAGGQPAAHANGVGNAHDLVGRYYMCHLAGTLGEVEITGEREAVWHGYETDREGVYCRRRFALTAQAQRALGVGNVVARLHHPRIPDPAHGSGILSALYLAKPFIGYEYRKRLHEEGPLSLRTWMAHVGNVVADPFATAGFLLHWVRKRTLAERKFPSIIARPKSGRYSLDVHAEQRPNRSSRVGLTEARDVLGMPKIRIDWRYDAGDIETVKRALKALAQDFDASGCGKLRYDEARVEADILRDGAYGGHHIGTARMAASPRDGVVDADCRVHGVQNLFIAGSAVFPTSSQANPTLTIVALALRLADHLDRKLAPGAVGSAGACGVDGNRPDPGMPSPAAVLETATPADAGQ